MKCWKEKQCTNNRLSIETEPCCFVTVLDAVFGNVPSRESRFLSHCELGKNIIQATFFVSVGVECGAEQI